MRRYCRDLLIFQVEGDHLAGMAPFTSSYIKNESQRCCSYFATMRQQAHGRNPTFGKSVEQKGNLSLDDLACTAHFWSPGSVRKIKLYMSMPLGVWFSFLQLKIIELSNWTRMVHRIRSNGIAHILPAVAVPIFGHSDISNEKGFSFSFSDISSPFSPGAVTG